MSEQTDMETLKQALITASDWRKRIEALRELDTIGAVTAIDVVELSDGSEPDRRALTLAVEYLHAQRSSTLSGQFVSTHL